MKIRRQKRGIVMRIASVVAVSGLAIGGLFYGLNSVNATGLNKNYSYIKANYAVPNANVAWVSPNGDDNKGNGSESAGMTTKVTEVSQHRTRALVAPSRRSATAEQWWQRVVSTASHTFL